MSEIRLGDIIDDHCSRCRLPTNHSVVAVVNGAVRKVRCRTCDFEHDYRHGKSPARKSRPLSAFDQVLATLNPPGGMMPPPDGSKARRARRSAKE